MKSISLLAGGSLAVALAAAALTSVGPHARVYTFNYDNVLGTSLELKIGARSLAEAQKAEAAALSEIGRQANILSAWDAESEFSRWVRTSGQPVAISPELFQVLGLFDQWRDRTGGALDASAETITRLWKKAEQQQREPSPDEIAAAVRTVRQIHWRLDAPNRTATHLSDAPLALNSLAKSYIVGRVADAALAAGGISSVVVNIGGDLVVRGAVTEPVDIADPKSDAENSAPIARLAIHERAVATSGNYRRGEQIGGRRYSHIVDPRTGMPADQIISSTVVAANPADAGALATAFSVLTPADSRRLAATVPGVEFLLVTKSGEQVKSAGWSALQAPASLFMAAATPPAFLEQASAAPKWDPSWELTVNVELAQFNYPVRRPYLAVWVENQDRFPIRTIALWERKERYLPDLRSWYRDDQARERVEGSDLIHSISSATRQPGKYAMQWDGKDDAGKLVKAGKYTVFVEAAREHGTYQLIRKEVDFNGVPQKIQLPGNAEVSSASLDYHKVNDR